MVCGGVWRWCPCASDKPLRATFASSEWQVFMLQGNGKFSKGCNKSAGRPYWGPYNGDSGCDRHEAGFGIEGSRPEHRGPKLNMTRFAFGNHIQVRIQCMCSLTGASCAQLNLDIYTCVWLVNVGTRGLNANLYVRRRLDWWAGAWDPWQWRMSINWRLHLTRG